MRRFIAAGVAASVIALGAIAPAFAQAPPGIPYRLPGGPPGVPNAGGNPGNAGVPGGRGGGFQGGGQRGNGFQGGGQRGNGFQGGGQRAGGFQGGYRRHNGYGAAVGAGVAGLAAGAILGGALANQQPYYGDQGYYAPTYAPAPVYVEPEVDAEDVSGDGARYCASRYRSYDPESGTYVGFDGERHPCP